MSLGTFPGTRRVAFLLALDGKSILHPLDGACGVSSCKLLRPFQTNFGRDGM